MRELRTHLATREEFVERVQRQRREGYRLVSWKQEDEVRAVAGYRILELLFSGRTLYVDDLVTRSTDRSAGFGGQLFDWLVAEARRENAQNSRWIPACNVSRRTAFISKRMKIASHHFSLDLK